MLFIKYQSLINNLTTKWGAFNVGDIFYVDFEDAERVPQEWSSVNELVEKLGYVNEPVDTATVYASADEVNAPISNIGLTELASVISSLSSVAPSLALFIGVKDSNGNLAPIVLNENGAIPVDQGVLSYLVDSCESYVGGTSGMVGTVPGASIVSASSPTIWSGTFEDTLNVNTALGYNATQGYIVCDGPGELRVGLSTNGVDSMLTTDGTTSTVLVIPNGESVSLDGLSIHTIKIDATVNGTLYRVQVW